MAGLLSILLSSWLADRQRQVDLECGGCRRNNPETAVEPVAAAAQAAGIRLARAAAQAVGGGGGGGDVACLRMPDYCYQCMPDFGATFFYGLTTPGSSYMDNVVFDLQMDPDGNIIAFNWGQALFSGFNPVQTEFTGLPGAFTASYNISCPNVSVDKTPGYVAVNGSDIHFEVTDYGSGSYHDLQVTAVSGSGTWNLGHPVFGDTAVGTWSFHLGDAIYFSCSVQP
jgi:hypothetical protein